MASPQSAPTQNGQAVAERGTRHRYRAQINRHPVLVLPVNSGMENQSPGGRLFHSIVPAIKYVGTTLKKFQDNAETNNCEGEACLLRMQLIDKMLTEVETIARATRSYEGWAASWKKSATDEERLAITRNEALLTKKAEKLEKEKEAYLENLMKSPHMWEKFNTKRSTLMQANHRTELEEKDSAYEKILKENTQLKDDLASRDGEVQKANGHITFLDGQIEERDRLLADAGKETEGLKGELQQVKGDVSSKNEELEHSEQRNTSLQGQLNESQELATDLRKEVQDVQGAKQQLDSELVTKGEQIETKDGLFTELEGRFEEKDHALGEAHKENEKLLKDRHQIRDELVTNVEHLEKANDQIIGLKGEVKNMTGQIISLENQVAGKDRDLGDTHREDEDNKKFILRLQGDLTTEKGLVQERDLRITDLESRQAEMESTMKEKSAFIGELDTVKEELNKSNGIITKLQDDKAANEKSSEDAEVKIKALAGEKSDLQIQVKQLTEQVRKLSEKPDQLSIVSDAEVGVEQPTQIAPADTLTTMTDAPQSNALVNIGAALADAEVEVEVEQPAQIAQANTHTTLTDALQSNAPTQIDTALTDVPSNNTPVVAKVNHIRSPMRNLLRNFVFSVTLACAIIASSTFFGPKPSVAIITDDKSLSEIYNHVELPGKGALSLSEEFCPSPFPRHRRKDELILTIEATPEPLKLKIAEMISMLGDFDADNNTIATNFELQADTQPEKNEPLQAPSFYRRFVQPSVKFVEAHPRISLGVAGTVGFLAYHYL